MQPNSLISVLIRATYEQQTKDGTLTPADIFAGLQAYQRHFTDRVARKEPAAANFSAATDRFLEALEQALAERADLELDAVMIGEKYPTLDHVYKDAFERVIETARDFPGGGPEGFFTIVVPELGAEIDQYDRRWLRDEHGIRATPNMVREEDKPVWKVLESAETLEELDEGEYDRLLLSTIGEYPNLPFVAAQLVLTAEEEEVTPRAKKYLRSLTDYPAGKLGFYQDSEVTDNWLAHCRALLSDDQDDKVLPYAENLLRLGHDGPLMNTIVLALSTGKLKLTKAKRRQFPLISERLDSASSVGTGGFLNTLLDLFGQGKGEVSEDDFYSAMNEAMGGGAALRKLPPRVAAGGVVRVKVTLNGSKPPIWRRLELRADTPLEELHAIIQTVFEWTNSHLHSFENSRRDSFVSPHDPFSQDWSESYEGMTIADMFSFSGKKFTYHYDFGDSWYHDVVLEKELSPDSKATYPRCTAGRRAAPLDDMGGLWGFYDHVEAIKDPKHEMHEDAVDYLGEDFDAAAFDLKAIDGRLGMFR